jgi:hypothetical protein
VHTAIIIISNSALRDMLCMCTHIFIEKVDCSFNADGGVKLMNFTDVFMAAVSGLVASKFKNL